MIWHPDKNPEGSENFELAAEKFIQIAKAQDALLDPETKKNYEEYGNPDGRQTMSGSIGLPEFLMDESKWQLILLVYFGLLMFALPVMVWRWWSNTEQFAGTFKVYKLTLHHYANKVNEVTKLKQLPPILACCFEYTKIDVRASCSQDMDAILESESELKVSVASSPRPALSYCTALGAALQLPSVSCHDIKSGASCHESELSVGELSVGSPASSGKC